MEKTAKKYRDNFVYIQIPAVKNNSAIIFYVRDKYNLLAYLKEIKGLPTETKQRFALFNATNKEEIKAFESRDEAEGFIKDTKNQKC